MEMWLSQDAPGLRVPGEKQEGGRLTTVTEWIWDTRDKDCSLKGVMQRSLVVEVGW